MKSPPAQRHESEPGVTNVRRKALTALWACAPFALAVACAHAPPPEAPAVTHSPAPSRTLQQRYAGTYVYAGSAAEKAAVGTAVDNAVNGMGIATGFARSALLKHADIRPSYTIAFDRRGEVEVESPGYPPEVSPADGTEVKVKNKDGDESELSQRFVRGALLQQGRTDQGKGETEFHLQPDGKTLLVKRVMESDQLPRPVVFTLTYLRQSSPL